MSKEQEKKKIDLESDYIYCPSANNSLSKFMSKHPDGVNDEKAAQVLLTTPDKIRKYYDEAIKLIKKNMKLDDNS